jgi:hypothetical protein
MGKIVHWFGQHSPAMNAFGRCLLPRIKTFVGQIFYIHHFLYSTQISANETDRTNVNLVYLEKTPTP